MKQETGNWKSEQVCLYDCMWVRGFAGLPVGGRLLPTVSLCRKQEAGNRKQETGSRKSEQVCLYDCVWVRGFAGLPVGGRLLPTVSLCRKQETGNKKQETRNRKQDSGNRKPGNQETGR